MSPTGEGSVFNSYAVWILTLLLSGSALGGDSGRSPDAINTQAPGEHPPSPQASTALMSLPPGFSATLFAGEPDVHQPIAFEIDDRGRLWVVECYTYEGSDYDLSKRDRVVIFSDSDGDGRFDRRKVFWDQGQRLTGITLGFGGVWLTAAPHLLFLADRDGDDRPDAAPEVMLDGFSVLARHNMVNGLRWGPDGWLYGRHGITDTSLVGTPETPLGQRIRLNCSIWRYHPARRTFEVVATGTTNPWGLDFDDHGQWFFTNNVVNHLWHLVPGAHYERMHGTDFNPHLYSLIPPTADHFHWDTAGDAGDADNANRKHQDGRHDDFGGGHSHAGGMIYLGDNWPASYRGVMLMCNTHGRRINADRLVRSGSGYIATHDADFLSANNPWFRGVEMKYGPDGGVFLTDWSDLGECHDRDGVHRTSGRVYKITHGTVRSERVDLNRLSDRELVQLQLHSNDWFVRHARRLLQERAIAGNDLAEAEASLLAIFRSNDDPTRRLRAMWCLYGIDAIDDPWLIDRLNDHEEHVRIWAVRLLVDRGELSAAAVAALIRTAESEPSSLVRLYLASALQRLPVSDRWGVARPLAAREEDALDRVQPLMIWYGIEPAVVADPTQALALAKQTEMPLLRRFVARRLTGEIDRQRDSVDRLLWQATEQDRAHAADYLQGMAEALRGRHRVTPPAAWGDTVAALAETDDAGLASLQRELSVVFGDGRAVSELLEIVRNVDADPVARRDALRVVLESQPKDLAKALLQLKSDRVVGADAIRGLARYEDPQVPKQLLAMHANARHDHRAAIVETLSMRPSYAAELLTAVRAGSIDQREISATTAGNIASHNDERLTRRLEEVWGAVRTTPAEKQALIARYKGRLTPEALRAADLANGRDLFLKTCGNCHRMFGEGKLVGPDLTGSNRDHLDYLLENIVDPGRIVPAELRQSALLLVDGRVLTGAILESDENVLTLQTVADRQRIARDQIELIRPLDSSLMPDGLLTTLTDDQVRDLIAYLQSTR